MRTRDILIGFVVLVVLIGGVLLLKTSRDKKVAIPTPTPSVEEKIKETFGGLVIPADTDKAELKDVSGGDGFGIATRTEILVDLPEPPPGKFYQAKLENSNGKQILLGTFRVAKGGYLMEYTSSKYPGYEKILVTLGGNIVLEGSF